MAAINVCDICGKPIENFPIPRFSLFKHTYGLIDYYKTYKNEYELCESCYNRIMAAVTLESKNIREENNGNL